MEVCAAEVEIVVPAQPCGRHLDLPEATARCLQMDLWVASQLLGHPRRLCRKGSWRMSPCARRPEYVSIASVPAAPAKAARTRRKTMHLRRQMLLLLLPSALQALEKGPQIASHRRMTRMQLHRAAQSAATPDVLLARALQTRRTTKHQRRPRREPDGLVVLPVRATHTTTTATMQRRLLLQHAPLLKSGGPEQAGRMKKMKKMHRRLQPLQRSRPSQAAALPPTDVCTFRHAAPARHPPVRLRHARFQHQSEHRPWQVCLQTPLRPPPPTFRAPTSHEQVYRAPTAPLPLHPAWPFLLPTASPSSHLLEPSLPGASHTHPPQHGAGPASRESRRCNRQMDKRLVHAKSPFPGCGRGSRTYRTSACTPGRPTRRSGGSPCTIRTPPLAANRPPPAPLWSSFALQQPTKLMATARRRPSRVGRRPGKNPEEKAAGEAVGVPTVPCSAQPSAVCPMRTCPCACRNPAPSQAPIGHRLCCSTLQLHLSRSGPGSRAALPLLLLLLLLRQLLLLLL